MTRYLLLLIALIAGGNAVGAWMFGELTDAGILCAISAAAVLAADFAAYCRRRRYARARRTREEVWERRDAEAERYALDGMFEAKARLIDERRPVETFTVFDKVGEPVSAFDSHGHSAVWPFEAGGFE